MSWVRLFSPHNVRVDANLDSLGCKKIICDEQLKNLGSWSDEEGANDKTETTKICFMAMSESNYLLKLQYSSFKS